jgi:AraC-like DNA-binding protein
MSGIQAGALHAAMPADGAVRSAGASCFSLRAMGFAAQLCFSAPDLARALQCACASSALWCEVPFRCEVDGERMLVRTSVPVCAEGFDVHGATQFWLEFSANVVGEVVSPQAVHVPGEVEPPRSRTLDCLIHRRQHWYGLSFAPAERINPNYDPRLFQLLSEYLDERLTRVRCAESTTQALLGALAELDDLSHASAEELARRLGFGVRTLHRRLSAEGETYRSVLDDYRRTRCMRQLAGGVSAKQVAFTLGFADPAGFHRAFRRWTGSTVRAWQRTRSEAP